MKYIVMEIQTDQSGQVATIVKSYDNIKEAKAEFYRMMAAVAVSTLPVHSVVLLDNYAMAHMSGNNSDNSNSGW